MDLIYLPAAVKLVPGFGWCLVLISSLDCNGFTPAVAIMFVLSYMLEETAKLPVLKNLFIVLCISWRFGQLSFLRTE